MDSLEQYSDFGSRKDKRLIDDYLRPKIAGKDVGGDFIHDADVNSDHPYDLVRKHAPASSSTSGNGDDRVWFFFSPERYVGGGGRKTGPGGRRGSESRNRNRVRTVLGADGKKKGAWHTEGKMRTVFGSDGGYSRSLTYLEVTPSGSVIKPGWLMLEYGIDKEHGDCGMVLCKVYRSPRCPGSDESSSRKRKEYVAEAERLQWPRHRAQEEEGKFSAGSPEREDLTDYRAVPGSGVMDISFEGFRVSSVPAHAVPQPFAAQPEDYDAVPPSCAAQPEDDAAVPPPCAARLEDGAVSCVPMSEQQVEAAEGDEIEFTLELLEKLMGSSSTPGRQFCSTPPSPTNNNDGDDGDMCGLACPPMDYDILDALVQSDPATLDLEEEFIWDL